MHLEERVLTVLYLLDEGVEVLRVSATKLRLDECENAQVKKRTRSKRGDVDEGVGKEVMEGEKREGFMDGGLTLKFRS